MTTDRTVRFAPSPTGRIHIGNARTALFNWLFAKPDGRFVLRLDDTDRERSTEEFARGIVEDLAWLGIVPDQTIRQSERSARHDAAAAVLRKQGLVYPCYETADELDRQRKRQQARRRPPIYDRSALRLSEDERSQLEADGRTPHWRFLLPNFPDDPSTTRRTDIEWNDVVRGPQSIDLASMSDPVLIREDGSYLYTLPSVVDDAELAITHVIRGDDHVANTAVQIALFKALGFSVPEFGHHNLLTTVDGEGLSKRSGALSLQQLRHDGLEPVAVASLAVQTGMSGQIDPKRSLDSLRDGFDIAAASRSAAKFDPAELDHLNAAIVHELAFEAVRERLIEQGIPPNDAEALWRVVRGNCERVGDARAWHDVITTRPSPEFSDDDARFVREAFELLPDEEFDESTWAAWIAKVKAASGRKGKSLFMPIRLALTGLDHGPELGDLLPLIGRERTVARRP